jgi:ABC-type dipeptide/oligopeptide/nickel transport system permease subunit
VGVIAQSLAVAVGVLSSLLAGYYGRWIDALLMRLADITPAFPSRGAMVADGRDLLRVAPWVSFAPGLAIGIAVQGFNLVGNGLREAYDPKLRSER